MTTSLVSIWLDRLNSDQARACRTRVPTEFVGKVDPEVWDRSIGYTLARNRVEILLTLWNLVLLLALLLSGLVPFLHAGWISLAGSSVWSEALFVAGVLLIPHAGRLPFDWYDTFRLEERFGFNRTTPGLWLRDQVRSCLLITILSTALFVPVLALMKSMESGWWFPAWAVHVAFVVLLGKIGPLWILPLFHRLDDLEEGVLRERLQELGRRTRFPLSAVKVMDSSRRTRRSNAFLTGFGHSRRVVLSDTLLEQIPPEGIEAVVAHEIGHARKRHLQKSVLWTALLLLVVYRLMELVALWPPFSGAFGFAGILTPGPVLVLLLLVGGRASFWIHPVLHALSRRFEYQADAFAARVTGSPEPLVGALETLAERNLINPVPHPFHSWFHDSHPTLPERRRALRG